jgi:hypothetical protein
VGDTTIYSHTVWQPGEIKEIVFGDRTHEISDNMNTIMLTTFGD